jgi:hypothetical protein
MLYCLIYWNSSMLRLPGGKFWGFGWKKLVLWGCDDCDEFSFSNKSARPLEDSSHGSKPKIKSTLYESNMLQFSSWKYMHTYELKHKAILYTWSWIIFKNGDLIQFYKREFIKILICDKSYIDELKPMKKIL